MTPVLVFDIETIPDVDGLRRLDPAGTADLNDEAVAAAAMAARKEKTGSDFLPLHLHKVVAIACFFRSEDSNKNEPEASTASVRVRALGESSDSEAKIISDFYKIIERYSPTLVSWNGSGFDLQVLHYRALINQVQAPKYWDTGEDDRDFKYNNYLARYHSRHTDLMDVLALYNGRANAPLDDLAKLCGFPGKLGMDGSQVWPAYQRGELDQIRAYCETDVANTYLLYVRWQLMRGRLSSQEYKAEIETVRASLSAMPADHWKTYLSLWPS